ncbi:energy transducer TonB [Sphingobium sp. CR28]|uniref:energy transducer TonB n=1 Tax=Sphingobium sp. CR28 TaxID=3400272 RepID=UPI003FF099D5
MKYWILLAACCAMPAYAVDKSDGPKGNASNWFTTDDYPAEALATSAEGTVGMKFDIDATGKVTFCAVTQTSGSAALDETSCRLMKERGHFTPALDKTGKPVSSQGTRNVTWQIPEDTGTPISEFPRVTTLHFNVDEDGNASNCTATLKSGQRPEQPLPSFSPEGCIGVASSDGKAKLVDKEGKPVKAQMQVKILIEAFPTN